MKKILLLATLLSSTVAFSQTTIDYPGNGKTGFGGAVGLGSLSITEQPDSVSFTLTRGPGAFDSLIVFYIDIPQTEGVSSTAGLTGSSTDRYLAAVAGENPSTGRAILNFPPDFHPDGAVVFDKDSGRTFAFVSIPFLGTLIVGSDSFLVNRSATTYSLSSSKEAIGLSGSLNFKFVGTYIGKSGSRSNEAFGDPFNNYLRPAGALSFNPYNIVSYYTFMSGVLPVKLIDFKADKEGNMVNIHWSVADENNIDKYEVQRSTDGISFFTIASFKAKNSGVSLSYNTRDETTQSGVYYYRLIITERGRSEISKVVSLNITRNKKMFVVSFMAPKILNITLNNVSKGTYKLLVLNNNGQLMQSENMEVDRNYKNLQIQLNQNLATGIYRIALQSKNAKYAANIFVQ